MIKKSLIILLFCWGIVASAQVPLNKTVYDCNSNSRTIQTVLGEGKALIIAHKGVDCSICRNSAADLQAWAAQHTKEVEVWGAMTWKYTPSTFSPPCDATQQWVDDFQWDDIFAFPDSNRLWVNNATPRYYVYSPMDSTIVWQGSSRTVAQSKALEETTVGINRSFEVNNFKLIYHSNRLELNELNSNISQLRLIDVSGKIVLRKEIQSNSLSIDVSSLKRGIYILQLYKQSSLLDSRKLVFH